MEKLTLGVLVAIGVMLGIMVFTPKTSQEPLYGSIVANQSYDTTSNGFTNSTTTVNTTSTAVFTSVARVSYIFNNSAATLTCSLDAVGTTAASSTVAAGRGIIITPTSTGNYASAAFGECHGFVPCYPHRGAVNCLATAAVTIDKIAQ